MEKRESPESGVRREEHYIPIYVEGRDEPIINKMETNSGYDSRDSSRHSPNNSQADQHSQGNSKSSSIFSRVKNFPVRSGFDSDFFQNHQSNMGNSANARPTSPRNPTQKQQQGSTANNSSQEFQSPVQQAFTAGQMNHEPPVPSGNLSHEDSITKIQSIQKEVLELMDKVEQFNGTSKRDKDYIYLDEMLTQNLLKLDTIGSEGKENIKLARREAIKCINRCISVLETKTERAAASSSSNQ